MIPELESSVQAGFPQPRRHFHEPWRRSGQCNIVAALHADSPAQCSKMHMNIAGHTVDKEHISPDEVFIDPGVLNMKCNMLSVGISETPRCCWDCCPSRMSAA